MSMEPGFLTKDKVRLQSRASCRPWLLADSLDLSVRLEGRLPTAPHTRRMQSAARLRSPVPPCAATELPRRTAQAPTRMLRSAKAVPSERHSSEDASQDKNQ